MLAADDDMGFREAPLTGKAALPAPSSGLRKVARAASVARFLPPLSWLLGSSVLYRHAGLSYRLYPARNYQDQILWVCEAFDERESMAALAALVADRRSLVLDIGANVGIFTTYLARAAGPGSKVLAFEPNPETFRRLSENVRLNGQEDLVELRQHALGEAPARLTLHVPLNNLGGASLRHRKWPAATHAVDVEPVAPFLDGARDYERVVIKIDIEGAEDRVLLPLFRTVAPEDWPDAILLEVSSEDAWDGDVLGALKEHGFRQVMSADRNQLFQRDRARAVSPAPR